MLNLQSVKDDLFLAICKRHNGLQSTCNIACNLHSCMLLPLQASTLGPPWGTGPWPAQWPAHGKLLECPPKLPMPCHVGREQAQRQRFLAIFQNSPNGHMAGGGGGALGLFFRADSKKIGPGGQRKHLCPILGCMWCSHWPPAAAVPHTATWAAPGPAWQLNGLATPSHWPIAPDARCH